MISPPKRAFKVITYFFYLFDVLNIYYLENTTS